MSTASDAAGVVPVVIVGAGPTGVTAATLLAQHGIECLVLDRWENVYAQPRAVHLDDEIFRILGRVGIADEFSTISRPAHGMQLRDRKMRVLAEFRRDTVESAHGYPRANMFDQPELETLLRVNLKRYPHATLRGNSEVTDIVLVDPRRVQVTFTDRVSGHEHHVEANYLLGCDGANSVVRASIGASMEDLKFHQRWLVVDVATAADLDQWDGVHQICDPYRAATFMRIGETRYRWEFRLLAGETASDFSTMVAASPADSPVGAGHCTRAAADRPRRRVHVPGATGRPLASRQHLPSRRRRPPDAAVHRPGIGSGNPGRDEPGVEAGGRDIWMAPGIRVEHL